MSRNTDLIRVWRSLSVTARLQLRDLHDRTLAAVQCDGRVIGRLAALTLVESFRKTREDGTWHRPDDDGEWYRITDLGREVHTDGVEDYLDEGPP